MDDSTTKPRARGSTGAAGLLEPGSGVSRVSRDAPPPPPAGAAAAAAGLSAGGADNDDDDDDEDLFSVSGDLCIYDELGFQFVGL